jgi:glycosyltransferase involved in cell wall biosynthesis
VLLEAMACGLPIVASGAGGNPELLEDQRTGLVIDPTQHEEAAGEIAALLVDARRMETFSRRALERSARFRWPVLLQETTEILRSAEAQPAHGQ